MKNRFILFILLFLSAGICAEQRKISDEDIIRMHSQIDHSGTPGLIAPCFPLSTNNYDPYAVLQSARKKAQSRTKRTYSASMSEIVITDVSAALQDAEMHFTGDNYVGRRPDHTNCKHGHHNLSITMFLGDSSSYKGTANYDCSYSGYQPISNSVGSVSGMVRPEQWAPWYVEHTVTQHISITSFAKSAGISNEEMVKRILYYGIVGFVINGNVRNIQSDLQFEETSNIFSSFRGVQIDPTHIAFPDNGISNALFRAAGYEPKLAAFQKKEYAAGMAEWKDATEEMAKEQPDIEKASQSYIRASEHLWWAKQLNYDLVEEIDSIFINKYILPLYKAENADKQAIQNAFEDYRYLVESIKTPNSEAPYKLRSSATRATNSAVYLMWLMKVTAVDYDSTYFAAYDELRTKGQRNEAVNSFLVKQKNIFIKKLDENMQTNPKFVILATYYFLNNPMKLADEQDSWFLYYSTLERAYRVRINYSSKDYDAQFFNYYNKYYNMLHHSLYGSDFRRNFIEEHHDAFFKTLEDKATSDPEFIVRVCTNYLNNPLKGYNEEYDTGLIQKHLKKAQKRF
jgi:hypothetical protein